MEGYIENEELFKEVKVRLTVRIFEKLNNSLLAAPFLEEVKGDISKKMNYLEEQVRKGPDNALTISELLMTRLEFHLLEENAKIRKKPRKKRSKRTE